MNAVKIQADLNERVDSCSRILRELPDFFLLCTNAKKVLIFALFMSVRFGFPRNVDLIRSK